MRGATACLDQFLSSGPFRLGQLWVEPSLSVIHHEDRGVSTLEEFSDPHAAIEIARYDADGNYRPLKTAPNLRRGWCLRLSSRRDLRLALDFLYPAALGTLAAWTEAGVVAVPLRETLGRQTGMYAVTRRLTDAQAQEVRGELCDSGCLRRILWSLGNPEVSFPVFYEPGCPPLLCGEACNLFVAAARQRVKATPP